MTNNQKQSRRLQPLSWLLACGVWLTACSSTPAPEQDFYLLHSDSQTNITEISGQPNVSIRRVKLPHYLNQEGIVRQLDNGQIAVSMVDLWAEKLSQSVPTLLAKNLAVALQAPVEINPLPPGISVDTLVEVNITRFIGDGKQLSLQADYRLIKPKKLQTYHFATTLNLADSSTITLVNGYAAAIKALAAEIAPKL